MQTWTARVISYYYGPNHRQMGNNYIPDLNAMTQIMCDLNYPTFQYIQLEGDKLYTAVFVAHSPTEG